MSRGEFSGTTVPLVYSTPVTGSAVDASAKPMIGGFGTTAKHEVTHSAAISSKTENLTLLLVISVPENKIGD